MLEHRNNKCAVVGTRGAANFALFACQPFETEVPVHITTQRGKETTLLKVTSTKTSKKMHLTMSSVHTHKMFKNGLPITITMCVGFHILCSLLHAYMLLPYRGGLKYKCSDYLNFLKTATYTQIMLASKKLCARKLHKNVQQFQKELFILS